MAKKSRGTIRENNIKYIEAIYKKYPDITYDQLVGVLQTKWCEETICFYIYLIDIKYQRLKELGKDIMSPPIRCDSIPDYYTMKVYKRIHPKL